MQVQTQGLIIQGTARLGPRHDQSSAEWISDATVQQLAAWVHQCSVDIEQSNDSRDGP